MTEIIFSINLMRKNEQVISTMYLKPCAWVDCPSYYCSSLLVTSKYLVLNWMVTWSMCNLAWSEIYKVILWCSWNWTVLRFFYHQPFEDCNQQNSLQWTLRIHWLRTFIFCWPQIMSTRQAISPGGAFCTASSLGASKDGEINDREWCRMYGERPII